MTDLSFNWSTTSARFVFRGRLGAVVLQLENPDDEWLPERGIVHRPAGLGELVAPGICTYVQGPCHTIDLPHDRMLVPAIKWSRHDNDPSVLQPYLERWYKEYIKE